MKLYPVIFQRFSHFFSSLSTETISYPLFSPSLVPPLCFITRILLPFFVNDRSFNLCSRFFLLLNWKISAQAIFFFLFFFFLRKIFVLEGHTILNDYNRSTIDMWLFKTTVYIIRPMLFHWRITNYNLRVSLGTRSLRIILNIIAAINHFLLAYCRSVTS